MFEDKNSDLTYKSYYFKKLLLPITKLDEINAKEDNFDHAMEIDLCENMNSGETSINLENSTVSSLSEKSCENLKSLNKSNQGSDMTNTNIENKKTNTVQKTEYIFSILNEKPSTTCFGNNLLHSEENPSIFYHLKNKNHYSYNLNNTSYSYSSDESENIQKYSELKKVYFTNSKFKCKHDTNSEHSKCKLPRQFQHHIITDLDKQHYENVLPFVQASWCEIGQDILLKAKVYKNFKCPKTACLEEEYRNTFMRNGNDLKKKICNTIEQIVLKDSKEFNKQEKKHLLNLITWRYSRRLTYLKKSTKFTKEVYEETEYMCRMCKGKNWINNTVYFKHLFEEHGITTSLKIKTPFHHSIDIDSTVMIDCIQKFHLNRDILQYIRVRLLPLPLRMFVDFKKNQTDARYFMQCGVCYKYVKSGIEENTSFSKFFKDHMMDSQCLYFNDPCYILGY